MIESSAGVSFEAMLFAMAALSLGSLSGEATDAIVEGVTFEAVDAVEDMAVGGAGNHDEI